MRLLVPAAAVLLASLACGERARPDTTPTEPTEPTEPPVVLPPMPPAVGPTAYIRNVGKAYDQINESDCLTWPSPEAKAHGGRNGWPIDFEPPEGKNGIVIGEAMHCEQEGVKVAFVQFDDNVVAVDADALSPYQTPPPPLCDRVEAMIAAAGASFDPVKGESLPDFGSTKQWQVALRGAEACIVTHMAPLPPHAECVLYEGEDVTVATAAFDALVTTLDGCDRPADWSKSTPAVVPGLNDDLDRIWRPATQGPALAMRANLHESMFDSTIRVVVVIEPESRRH